jgi:copper homeostasis protein
MIRPRGGGFVYTEAERDVMRRDVIVARELGADGVVIGGLCSDASIDLSLVRCMVEAARGLPVTFHRAFDLTPDLEASLDSLADAGVARVLSAGGAATAVEGAATLANLVHRAGSRIIVIAGGGVREDNASQLLSTSGVRELHVRLTRVMQAGPAIDNGVRLRRALPADERAWEETDAERVRRLVRMVAANPESGHHHTGAA